VSRTAAVLSVCVLVLSVPNSASGFDDSVVVRPRLESYWTGRANVNGGKWSGNLAITTNPDFRAWVMFDLASVPDSSRVIGAVLHYTVFSCQDSAFGLWRHRRRSNIRHLKQL